MRNSLAFGLTFLSAVAETLETHSISMSPTNFGGIDDSNNNSFENNNIQNIIMLIVVGVIFFSFPFLLLRRRQTIAGGTTHQNMERLFTTPPSTPNTPNTPNTLQISANQAIIDQLNTARKERGETAVIIPPENFLCTITFEVMTDPVLDLSQLNEKGEAWANLSPEGRENQLLKAIPTETVTQAEINTKRSDIKKDEKNICGNYYLIGRAERSALLKCSPILIEGKGHYQNPFTREYCIESSLISDKEMKADIEAFVEKAKNEESSSRETCVVPIKEVGFGAFY